MNAVPLSTHVEGVVALVEGEKIFSFCQTNVFNLANASLLRPTRVFCCIGHLLRNSC